MWQGTLPASRPPPVARRRSLLLSRMKRNPRALDVRVCRAVLWWNILSEAMEAAREAELRRARRREMRGLVVALAISQRRAGRAPGEAWAGKGRMLSCPPHGVAPHGGVVGAGPCSSRGRRMEVGEVGEGRGGVSVALELGVWWERGHLDEAAILRRIYDFL